MQIKATDIVHVVPLRENLHALYLRDGRIVQIYVPSGDVQGVSQLPDESELGGKLAETEERFSQGRDRMNR
jgi:hypothetical protein